MRDLHARHDYGGAGARTETLARRDARRARGELVPLHRVFGDLQVRSSRLGLIARDVYHEATKRTKDTKYSTYKKTTKKVFVIFVTS